MTDYEPLSVRRGLRAKIEGHPGIPPAARFSVRHWLEGQYGYRSPAGMRVSLVAQVALAVGLEVRDSYEAGNIMEQSISPGERNDELYLDIIDATLKYGSTNVAPLEQALDASGSLWRVSGEQDGLERRVDVASASSAERATSPSDEASTELLEAWDKVYGREPDASDAWDHAIKAVEAMMVPVVIPARPKGTLGQVLGEIAAHPDKWTLGLSTSSTKIGAIGTLEGMLRFMWPNPDRHGGTGATRQPTVAEAEAVVQLAVMLVQWIRVGLLS